jgi:hypothetical protein
MIVEFVVDDINGVSHGFLGGLDQLARRHLKLEAMCLVLQV